MEKKINYHEGTVSYTITGSGQPLILVHGFGEDSTIWQYQIDELEQQFTVITPDLPGSGQSAFLPGENIGMETYADCLHTILHSENITQCVLLGHSMGGYITLAFAEAYPEMLSGFGLVNSTAFADNEAKKASRQQGITVIETYGAGHFLQTAIPGLFSRTFKEANADKVDHLVESGKTFSNEALVQYYTAMMNRPDRTSVLRSAAVPVLFIVGSEDNAAPQNDLLQQVHLPSRADIHILEGVGHMSMLEKPTDVTRIIAAFTEWCSDDKMQ